MTAQAAVAEDQSRVGQLVDLLEKSTKAWEKVDPPWGAGGVLSYVNYIEKRVTKKMPDTERREAISDAWRSLNPSCDPEDAAETCMAANPRLPAKVRAELGRRLQAYVTAHEAACPTYDAIIEFLGLEWAFQDAQLGHCADPIDKQFLSDTDLSDVIGEYEGDDPFDTVEDSITLGSATAEEAEELIDLASAVNAARAGYRNGKTPIASEVLIPDGQACQATMPRVQHDQVVPVRR